MDSGERYYTWVDEQGRVRQSPIQAAQETPEQNQSIEQVAAQAQTEQVQPSRQSQPESPSTSMGASQPSSDLATGPETAPPIANSEYNLANYPDGDELAKAGFIREGDRLPYFTWRDADGNIRVSYFRPDTRSAVERGVVKPPLELTTASVHLASDQAPTLPHTETGALPEAFAILGIEAPQQSYFQRWRAYCCDSLGLRQVEDWPLGREFRVLVEPSSPSWPLLEGASHFRLVKLPRPEELGSFVMQLRSFNQNGMFIPSLAFLDDSLQPLRVVTDLVPDYRPENWHRLGYLQVLVPVLPQQGERWLMIYTRDADVANQTVIETERGPKAIEHTATGMLSLTVVEPW